MVITQSRSRLSKTGSRYVDYRKKKQYESGSNPTMTKIGERRAKSVRVRGANKKYRLMITEQANVVMKDKKVVKAKVLNVEESPANKQYVRRNVITKGAVIETDKGKARVTSRPGQDGTVNAVLV